MNVCDIYLPECDTLFSTREYVVDLPDTEGLFNYAKSGPTLPPHHSTSVIVVDTITMVQQEQSGISFITKKDGVEFGYAHLGAYTVVQSRPQEQ